MIRTPEYTNVDSASNSIPQPDQLSPSESQHVTSIAKNGISNEVQENTAKKEDPKYTTEHSEGQGNPNSVDSHTPVSKATDNNAELDYPKEEQESIQSIERPSPEILPPSTVVEDETKHTETAAEQASIVGEPPAANPGNTNQDNAPSLETPKNTENPSFPQQVTTQADHINSATTQPQRPSIQLTANTTAQSPIINEEPKPNEEMIYSRPTSDEIQDPSAAPRAPPKVKWMNRCFKFCPSYYNCQINNWGDCALWSCCALLS